jgi:outer membrane protein OmpA-like peptidoglycan-associated protein
MPMSESSPSVWKGLFWLLLIALIGVYVVYDHYADTLKARIAAAEGTTEKTAPAEMAQRVETDGRSRGGQVDACEQRLAETEQALAAARADLEQRTGALEGRLARARQTTAEVRAFYDGLADLGARLTDHGILLTLDGDALRFPSGASMLPDGDLPALDRIAELLRERPDLRARIEGYTDSSGSAAINRGLSEQRASAVRDALVDRGIAGDRLSATGRGADRPVADNATAAGREANRRVEVWIVEPDEG